MTETESGKTIRVSEIFGPTIQGEGAVIGRPTVFVRTGGCDYRCAWCDSLHAVESRHRDEWRTMSAQDILARIMTLSGDTPLLISLSGGNPAIQPLAPLISAGKKHGYSFALETQGTVAQDWFADLDILTLSPKPPSSGMITDWEAFDRCVALAGNGPLATLKIVVFDEQDYRYARDAATRYPALPVYLQPGNHTPPPGDNAAGGFVDLDGIADRLRWLAGRVAEDRWFSASVLPQLHVMMWGNQRGV